MEGSFDLERWYATHPRAGAPANRHSKSSHRSNQLMSIRFVLSCMFWKAE